MKSALKKIFEYCLMKNITSSVLVPWSTFNRFTWKEIFSAPKYEQVALLTSLYRPNNMPALSPNN